MEWIFLIAALILFWTWPGPENPKRPTKKFGDGLLNDTDTTNWNDFQPKD